MGNNPDCMESMRRELAKLSEFASAVEDLKRALSARDITFSLGDTILALEAKVGELKVPVKSMKTIYKRRLNEKAKGF